MKGEIKLDFIKSDTTGGHLCVSCKILDRDYILLIDTGASHTVFDSNLPASLFAEKNKESFSVEGFSEVSGATESATIKEIVFGKLYLKNLHVKLIDLSHINHVIGSNLPYPLAGMLGGDFLSIHKAKIDYSRNKIKLHL